MGKRISFPLWMIWFCFSCAPHRQTEPETLPFYNTATFDAEWITPDEPAYRTIHTIQPFSLTNQVGHTITTDSLNGSIYVANFFFSVCPSICPKMMSNLKAVQDTFATDARIKLVSFSVMPWADSVARLRQYGQARQINPAKWHLLTGPKETIYRLGRTSYFAEKAAGVQKDSSDFLHTESMLLIDRKGRIRGIYDATQKSAVERIIADIQLLFRD